MPSADKRDRTARLLRVEHLLYQHGLKANEIARLCGVSVRTAYRDLHALQSELQLPLWQDEYGRYGLERASLLPPLKLSLVEATALYIAARLACRYADERDPAIESAFAKLATILPRPIARRVYETVGAIATRKGDEAHARIFDILATAWAQGRRVRIWYRRLGEGNATEETSERVLDPYALEPSAIGHACYVIGFDHRSGEVRTFKVERIHDAELTAEEFAYPDGWSVEEYLRTAWGVMHEEEVEVRVRFSPAVAGRVKEAIWHPSQSLSDEPSGYLLFSARVAGTLEIARWLLGWGAEVEVLAPPELRDHLAGVAGRLATLYGANSETKIEATLPPVTA